MVAGASAQRDVDPLEADLTIQHGGEPIGERMIVTGRVLDGDGRPVRRQLVEIWQANAGGRYIHQRDQHPAPLDPHFTGMGRCLTDDDGRYAFTTIKPGPYPWRNHHNAWRPAHIHFSLFGTDFTQRMVTQMYFPGDPLFALDPIYQSILDPAARDRLVATYDHDLTQHEWATGYRWDIVLTGVAPHPDGARRRGDPRDPTRRRPGQTVGPFFGFALPYDGDRELVAARHSRARSGCTASCTRRRRRPGARTRSSRSGRPTPTARSSQRPGLAAPRRVHLHRVRALRHGQRRATTRSPPLAPGAVDGGRRSSRSTVFARGLLNRLFTRAYLPRPPAPTRPAARLLPADRRDTLVCDRRRRRPRFDIRLQGDGETVFLHPSGTLSRMTDLFWPGDDARRRPVHRRALLEAMVAVEGPGWRAGGSGSRRRGRASDLLGRRYPTPELDCGEAEGGNPVIPLVDAAARRAPVADARPLHRGLTSQDVIDSALMLLLARRRRRASGTACDEPGRASGRLARRTGDTPMVGRTLTQHAVPIDLRRSRSRRWLAGVARASTTSPALAFPVPGRRSRRYVAGPSSSSAPPITARPVQPAASSAHASRRRGHQRPAVTRWCAAVRCTDAWGPDRPRRPRAEPSRDRRARRSAGRRIVVHAAQGQPGALRR